MLNRVSVNLYYLIGTLDITFLLEPILSEGYFVFTMFNIPL
jgi:hypothetical protein